MGKGKRSVRRMGARAIRSRAQGMQVNAAVPIAK